MSWEIIRLETRSCDCGAGNETFQCEMDDWNRTRDSTEIHCPHCREVDRLKREADAECEKRREDLLAQVKKLTIERYSILWQALFSSITKKEAWQRYTGSSRYPTLGTFYRHVKHYKTLGEYMDWLLSSDPEHALSVLGVKDEEIDSLLKERKQLWKPTSGPM